LLGGKRFASNEEVITETGAHFKGFNKIYFLEGLKKLEYRWIKCIKLEGDYIQKKKKIIVFKRVFISNTGTYHTTLVCVAAGNLIYVRVRTVRI